MSAVCSTREYHGSIHTVLKREGNKYTCTCAGESMYSLFAPTKDTDGKKRIHCVIIHWECPELT